MIDKKEKSTQEKITIIQVEEINRKLEVKEGRIKRYQQRAKQNRQNRTFQNWEEMTLKHTNDWMQ